MASSLSGRTTFGGLATGLDTNSLLQGLLALERQPLTTLNTRRSEIDSQRGLMRELNTKILALREASQELDNRNSTGSDFSTEEEFLRYAASTSDEDIVTVSAGFGASPGEIDVTVKQLATNSRRFSDIFESATETPVLAQGDTLSITLPNGRVNEEGEDVEDTLIEITADGDSGLSLQSIRDQINASPDNGGTVRADVLQLSENEFRLVLTSTGTGSSNELEVSGPVAIDDSLSQAARNSVVSVFGQDIDRDTNLIDDILPGITLRLRGASQGVDPDNPIQPLDPPSGDDPSEQAAYAAFLAEDRISEKVTVDVDVDEVAKALEKFANAYNDVQDFVDKQFRYNESTKTAGPLSGDSTLRSVQSQLRRMVSTGYQFSLNPNNPFASTVGGAAGGTISGIGLELKSGGRLALDRVKLEEALAEDAFSVRQFLSGLKRDPLDPAPPIDPNNPDEEPDFFDEGFATAFSDGLERLVRSGDGALASRDKAFALRLKDYDNSIERFESRLQQREETLIARFSNLEQIVSGLQGQQGFLGSLG